jgi:iron complex outermembrane receptor protein
LSQLGADPSQPPLYAYKPEYSNNFELGIKNTFLENRARANISFFYTTITDAQVPTLVLPAAITITKNAGSLTNKGMDAELAATVLKGLEATYNFGYTDAKYTKLELSQNGSETDLSGNRQIFTPDITSLLALQYSISLISSNKLQLIIRGEWTYLGKQYFDLANSITQSPYNLLNTRLGLKIKHAELYFWERNMANIKYIAYGYDFGAVHLGNPRTFGFTFRASM